MRYTKHNIVRSAVALLGAALMASQLVGAPIGTTVPLPNSSLSFEQALPVTPAQKEVSRLLQQISANARIAGRHAENLDSYARVGSQISFSSHAGELTGAKEAINDMGADFRKLQELRPNALPWQQALIDRMEPVLFGMAGNTTEAIELLNENRHMLPSEEYREAIANLYASAGEAGTLVSVSLNYAQAREKLNRLDASFAESVAETTAPASVSEVSSNPAKSLEQRVRSELLRLPYYGVFDHLAFQVDGGHITLLGEVSSPVLKSDAEAAVRGVEGVEGITSEIKVLPLSPADNRIRLAAYAAIYGQPTLAPYRLNPHPPIRIIVENGHVTLKGVVGSELDRTLAYMQASSVLGAFSVTNHLQIGS